MLQIKMDQELISQQLEQLRTRPHTEGIKEISDSSFYILYSPQLTDSPYSHLVFNVKVTLPDKYPDQPPFLAFKDKIYHLNVDPITGQVSMPILKDDWSPFLTLSAVFDSLDSILEEPEVDYAATEGLRSEYMNDPDKYAKKVSQMVNLIASEAKEQENNSIVEHVEEIVDFKSCEQGIILNNSFERPQFHQEEATLLKNSLPYSQIPKSSKQPFESPQVEKAKVINIQNQENRQQPQFKKNDHQHFQSRPQDRNNGKYQESESERKLPLSMNNKQPSNKKKLSPTFSILIDKEGEYDEVQVCLKKSDQLIQVLLQGCEAMQNSFNSSHNQRVRELLSKRLQPQWNMVQQLLQITSKLKQKLFQKLKGQAKLLLK